MQQLTGRWRIHNRNARRTFLCSGQLVRVLEDWSPSVEGLFLYYLGHRQVPAALRALIDMIRVVRGSPQVRRAIENPFTKG